MNFRYLFMRIFHLYIILIFISFSSSASQLDSLLERIDEIEAGERIPSISDYKKGQRFPSISLDTFSEVESKYQAIKIQVEGLLKEDLDEQEKIDLKILMHKLDNDIAYYTFQQYFIPFNSEGGFYNQALFTLRTFEIESVADANYLMNWLKDYSKFLLNYLPILEKGIENKILPPKLIVENNLKLIEPFLVKNLSDHPLYTPFLDLRTNLDDKDVKNISTKSVILFNEDIRPAYQKLHDFLKEQYLPKAYDEIGISNIPRGEEYYRNRIRHYATYAISPEEVHKLGLKEVKRIKELMIKCIDSSGYDGSFEEFLIFLREHPRFYPRTDTELLHFAAWLSKKAEGQLPKYFKQLPELPFTVEPVPLAIAPNYTAGRFVHGSWERQEPGIYWVNTYNLSSRSLYNLPALTLHEAVPGHHLQTQLASEQDNLSVFRQNYYISAFGEGWGLYSEYLGEEMGMYSNIYELFGRYTYEMWRACRLVVDTGMHYKGWSRSKAIEFLSSNTALSIHEVNTEIDRYIGWPGQAVSYKLGELKIKELRNSAEKSLGSKFDVREFHYEVLKNGSVTLPILEEQVDSYIRENN